MREEILKMIEEDDRAVTTTDEQKKQTALLEKLVEQTAPSPANNWMNVLTLDLNNAHDSYEVWKMFKGHPFVNSMVIPAQDIDYYYEIEPGKRVPIDAGMIMDIGGHNLKLLRITNTDTTNAIMNIVLSGYDPSKP